MITMNIKDEDLIGNKVVTKKELKQYHELKIHVSDGHKKWLFLHKFQDKVTQAREDGVVTEVVREISEPKQTHAIRGAN